MTKSAYKSNLNDRRKKKLEEKLPVSLLHKLLRHDRDTGKLFWKTAEERGEDKGQTPSVRLQLSGREALTYAPPGDTFRGIVNGVRVQRHIVIWAMEHGEWPEFALEFIDENFQNPQIDNLRPKTRSRREVAKLKAQSILEAEKKHVGGGRRLTVSEISDIFRYSSHDGSVVLKTIEYDRNGDIWDTGGEVGEDIFTQTRVRGGLLYASICGTRLFKHHASWVLNKGEYPDGLMISFADGDNTNCRIENLIAEPQD